MESQSQNPEFRNNPKIVRSFIQLSKLKGYTVPSNDNRSNHIQIQINLYNSIF